MKLTGTNSTILQAIRQPTQLSGRDSLAFIYPFLIDKQLDKKFGRLLRDFFTCQITAQIKTSNVLNITVKATNAGSSNQTLSQVENAAERTVQDTTLGLLTPPQPEVRPNLTGLLKQNYQDQQKYEYDNKLNKFREFILDQLKNDPKYSEFNVLVSNITIENLLDIPLIIGTSSKSVNSLPLFWILLAAAGQYRTKSDQERESNISVRMDRPEAFDYIKRAIRNINVNNYEKLLHVNNLIPVKLPTNRIEGILNNIDDELDKAIKTFYRATNESDFSEDTGISQHQALSITNILQSSLTTQRNINSKAITLFSSLIANYIVPIAHAVTAAIVTADEVNVSNRISDLVNNLLTATSQQYTSLNNQVTQSLQQETTEQTGNLLSQFEGMCKTNSAISVTKMLLELSNSRFKITGTRESFIDFVESIMKISNQLNTYRSNLENQLIDLANESEYTRDQLKEFGNSNVGFLKGLIHTITSSTGHQKNVTLDQTNGTIVRIFQQYFQEDLNGQQAIKNSALAPLINPDETNPSNNRLSTMIGANDQKHNIIFINNIITALTNITVFFAYYTFFSYLCEFIQEINATIQSQKKDVLDFPNYCLVVNKTVIEAIYTSLAAFNYSKSKQAEKEPPVSVSTNRKLGAYQQPGLTKGLNLQDIKDPYQNKPSELDNVYTQSTFKITESEIMNMLRTLNSKLHIPNIIVVDEKTNTIYYKWMYSGGSIGKLPISTVQNYVTHQKQALTKM